MKLVRHYFGEPRQSGSHVIFKTPWAGDPRINLQTAPNGKAKEYQIKQQLSAIEKLQLLPEQSAAQPDNKPRTKRKPHVRKS